MLRYQKSGRFEPEKFEDQYETALIDLINQKRAGKPIVPKERKGENVVDLMEALRRSVGGAAGETEAPKKATKKPRKAAAAQKEMLRAARALLIQSGSIDIKRSAEQITMLYP